MPILPIYPKCLFFLVRFIPILAIFSSFSLSRQTLSAISIFPNSRAHRLGHNPRGRDHHLLLRYARRCPNILDHSNNIHPVDDLAKHNVSLIQPRRDSGSDEELRPTFSVSCTFTNHSNTIPASHSCRDRHWP